MGITTTAEQKEAISHVLNTSKYWEILGIPKKCEDSALMRKQYRRLARLLHPDKNPLQGAVKAFQKIDIAYNCYCDDTKRSNYLLDLKARKLGRNRLSFDQYSSFYRPHPSSYSNHHFTQDDLFSMLFNHPQRQHYYYHFPRRPPQTAHTSQMDKGKNSFFLYPLILLTLLILLSFFSNSDLASPTTAFSDYNFNNVYPYVIYRETKSLQIPYYVKRGFFYESLEGKQTAEKSIEDNYLHKVTLLCNAEAAEIRRYTYLARSSHGRERDHWMGKIDSSNKHSCQTLEKIRQRQSEIESMNTQHTLSNSKETPSLFSSAA